MNFNEVIGKTLTFPIYNSSGMGGDVVESVLEAVMNHSLVPAATGENPDYLHNTISPHLPKGIANSARDYQWLIMRTPSGTVRAIGVAWISGEVVEDKSALITVTIRGKTLSTIPQLNAILRTNGFTDIEITTE